jgi:pentatricopeptide repeat protein
LEDRTSGPEEEWGENPFNVNDVRAKDKASYSLLVKGAVSSGDWQNAIHALGNMTQAGLYPNSRNLNSWVEASERKSKQNKSWKKKREEYWLTSVR